MAKQEERRAATRETILRAATLMFGEKGFEATRTDELALQAGVSKGSVFNHFPSKRDIFIAVFEEVSSEVASRCALVSASGQADLLKAMLLSVEEFFRCCTDAHVAQIMLRDGPNVLGWEEWRARDAAHFGGLVEMSLKLAMDAKVIRTQPLVPLSTMLLGALQSASIDCASSDDLEEAAKRYLRIIEGILEGLK